MIKKRKIFIDPINDQIKWLNDMSDQGYRLVEVKGWTYTFEKSKAGEYVYSVEFIAHKSRDEIARYVDLLDELNVKTFIKKINFGKKSLGNVRLRPYGVNATNFVLTGRELLILEKKNDGKPFESFTEANDRIKYYKLIRNAFVLPIPFLLIAILYGEPRLTLLGKDYSSYVAMIGGIFKSLGIVICVLLALTGLKYISLIKREKSNVL